METYILYGAGRRCKILCDVLRETDIEITCIIDSNSELWGKTIGEHIIQSPAVLKNKVQSIFCVTVQNEEAAEEIRCLCRQNQYLYNEINYNELIKKAFIKNRKINGMMRERVFPTLQEYSVLFDSYAGLGLGGVECWTVDICKQLIEQYSKHIFIITRKGSYSVSLELQDHILEVDVGNSLAFSLKNIEQLVKIIISKLPCKIVTSTVNDVMLAAYLVKRNFPNYIEIISVVHNSNEEMYKQYRDFIECPDIYIGVSQCIIEHMQYIGVEKERLFLMYIPFYCETEITRSYTEDVCKPIHIGYAGRIEKIHKRLDLLLKVVEELIKSGIYFRLEIAGSGSYLESMKKYIFAHHLENYVVFCGCLKRSEISDFWKRQDICVNVSDYEGRSISVTEGMGNGAVPVVTAVSGTVDDIVDSVNGYLVDIGDYKAIAEKIIYLSENRDLLKTMGKAAHDSVYPKSRMEPHFEFWKELLERRLIQQG